MRRRSRFSLALLAAALLAGCGGGIPHASVAPVPKTEAAVAPAAPTSTSSPTETHRIAADSEIEVAGSDSITGEHIVKPTRFSGTVSLTEPLSCSFVVEMSSLKAESAMIEDFLKSPRFLDVHRFPEGSFVTSKVARAEGPDAFLVEGRMTLHGIVKVISFPATIHREGDGARVHANFYLPRRAFGLTLPGMWDKLLDDDLRVRLDLVARSAPPR